MAIKAVIFDLDGTITEPYLDFDVIRAEIGLDKDAGSILDAMTKMTPDEFSHAEKVLHVHEQRAVSESTLNNGAKELLSALSAAGIRIGILTRNKRSNAIAVGKKHGLQFEAGVGREDGPVKPDAFGVLEICRQLGVKPSETIVVGDYLYDMQCAKAAGAIAVLLANHERADEFAEHADFSIKNIGQVLEIVENKSEGVSSE